MSCAHQQLGQGMLHRRFKSYASTLKGQSFRAKCFQPSHIAGESHTALSMLTSWFSQKSGQESEQQRPSEDNSGRPSTTSDPHPLFSFDSPKQKPSQPTHTTPHDAIIAQLQTSGALDPVTSNKNETGRVEYGAEDERRSPITPISPAASHSRLDLGLSPAPSMYTGATTANLRYTGNQPSGNQQHQSVDLLLDPFDGTSHGILFPQDNSIGPQDDGLQPAPRFNSVSVAAASEGMWSHLSKVLDLQTQIAKMHAEMEGIGIGDGRKKSKAKNGMGRGPTLREDRRVYHAVPPLRARAMSNASTIGTVVDEKETDEEGVGVADEGTEKNRAREEEFAKLAHQFEGKKESIKEMMNKLDELSKALTEFHALQAPETSTPKHTSTTPVSFPAAYPNTPESNISISHTSPPLPHIQFPDNMLWAPPKPLLPPESMSVLPQSLSRLPGTKGGPQKAPAPTLIVNSNGPPHVMESSPTSTLGSLQLLAEE